jgi:hypothetical protein
LTNLGIGTKEKETLYENMYWRQCILEAETEVDEHPSL